MKCALDILASFLVGPGVCCGGMGEGSNCSRVQFDNSVLGGPVRCV